MDAADPVVTWLLDAAQASVGRPCVTCSDRPRQYGRPSVARVETEGWAARLLSHQDADGQWDGGAFVPAGFTSAEWREHGQLWTATSFRPCKSHRRIRISWRKP
jgi:hypothetical protein